MTPECALNILRWCTSRDFDPDCLDADDAVRVLEDFQNEHGPGPKPKFHNVVTALVGMKLSKEEACKYAGCKEKQLKTLIKTAEAHYSTWRCFNKLQKIVGFGNIYGYKIVDSKQNANKPRPKYVDGAWHCIEFCPLTGNRILATLKKLGLSESPSGSWIGRKGRIRRVDLYWKDSERTKGIGRFFVQHGESKKGHRVPPFRT